MLIDRLDGVYICRLTRKFKHEQIQARGKSGMRESRYPRQHQRRDRPASGGGQAPRRLMESGAGGQHIIDQQNRPVCQPWPGIWRYRKGTGDIALALMPAEPALTSRRPPADQQVRGEGTGPGVMTQLSGPFGRLVVTPPEIASSVKRHRDDKAVIVTELNEKSGAKTGQKRRQLQPVAMFEMEDKFAGAVRIVETGADGRQRRRLCPATGAERVGKGVAKRQTTAGA